MATGVWFAMMRAARDPHGSIRRISDREKPMIRVVAIVTAKPGRREELLTQFRALVPTVHAEQGCIEYQPTIDAEGFGSSQAKMGSDAFIVIETSPSPDALKAHPVPP